MHVIRDAKCKKAESTENNRAARAAKKAADIAKQTTLGKATVEKIEAFEDDNGRVEDVVNITKPRMSEMLMMYRKTARMHTSKEALRLDYIVMLNTSGVLKNGTVVGG